MVDNHPSGWLSERGIGYEELSAVREDTILCQVTPFGNWGPYAKYDAGDLSLFHMSANAHGMLRPGGRPELGTRDKGGRIPGGAGRGDGGCNLDAHCAVRGANERTRVPHRRVGVRGDGDAGNRGIVYTSRSAGTPLPGTWPR